MIGIDLVKISRIESAVNRHGKRFLERFLSQKEIESSKNISQIASKWAAKEAVSKALGCGIGGRLGFLDIEIQKREGGVPYASLSPRCASIFGVSTLHLSIAHDGEYAVAVAFIYPPPTN